MTNKTKEAIEVIRGRLECIEMVFETNFPATKGIVINACQMIALTLTEIIQDIDK